MPSDTYPERRPNPGGGGGRGEELERKKKKMALVFWPSALSFVANGAASCSWDVSGASSAPPGRGTPEYRGCHRNPPPSQYMLLASGTYES